MLTILACSHVAWGEETKNLHNNVNSNSELARQESQSVFVLGDSLSAAYKLNKNDGWVVLLEEKLKANNVNATFTNASVSGLTLTGGLPILRRHLATNTPDLIVIELGANDGLQGLPVSRIKKQLTQLVNQSKNSGAKVLLLGVRLPPNRGARYTEPFFSMYRAVAETENVALVPFFLEGVAGDESLMLDDGLHPNQLGQPLILENVYPAVEKLLSVKK